MTPIDNARCLVLGAGGFIGSNLCAGLQKVGASVAGFGRRPAHPGLEWVPWHDGDFGDIASVSEALDGRDIVFHLLGGGVPAESNKDPASDLQLNVLPSLRLMEACRRRNVKKLLFISSGGTVYGRTSAHPVAEDAATDPITAYGISKLSVEKYLALDRHLHGSDSIVLRVANPYGPFQYARKPQGLVGAMMSSALTTKRIEIWGDGSTVRDFLYVGDVVDALIAAAGYEGAERVFNVGSGVGRSIQDVADAVLPLTGLTRDDVVYKASRPADVAYNVLDIGLIGREMGWRPRVDWNTGLAASLAWMREHLASVGAR